MLERIAASMSVVVMAALPLWASPAPETGLVPPARPDRSKRMEQLIGFDAWRDGFRVKALESGIAAPVFDAAFRGVTPNSRILKQDRSQPELLRPISDYIERAVSERRIRDGKRNAHAWAGTLEQIRVRYGVDPEGVLAIWGMETAYGAVRGNDGIIRSLSTLAYEGRRRDWAERELIAALTILQSGEVLPRDMQGSWAGAMGHTQFMPTSFLIFAQDFDGDGRRDIWAENPTDALASAAFYLKEHGWVEGAPWGVEVVVPEGFNFLLMDRYLSRPIAFWDRVGVRRIDGQPLTDYGNAAMLAPMGAGGPIFLTFANFDAIRAYNRSTSYAIAVGQLARQIAGAPGIATPWPLDVRPLRRSERREVQDKLTRMGYDTEGADGIIGPNSERAIRAFQLDRGLVPDALASNRLLEAVRAAAREG